MPEEGGDWYLLVDAINSTIVKKENIEASFVDGYGTVWNPDAGTFLENILLPDNNDDDYWELQAVYTDVQLQGLFDPVNNLYYLRGEYAYSYNYGPPEVFTSQLTPDFYFHRDNYGFEETNCYFHLDKVIRYVRSLGFIPEWNNATQFNPYDLLFDATGGWGNSSAGYITSLELVYFGVPEAEKDAAEDQSVIIHELGHAFHDAFIIGGLDDFMGNNDLRGIMEGFADYLGVDYRRQVSLFRPNAFTNWWHYDNRIPINDDYNFIDNWEYVTNYEKGKTWASALMDLEYISATDPIQGTRLGRDIVTTNQIAAFTYITGEATPQENVFAMYQADIDIYNGEHLREYIDVYHNRLLFDDQNVFNNIAQNTNWSGFKKINEEIHVLAGSTLEIEPYSVVVMDGEFIIDAGANLEIGSHVLFIGYESDHRITVNGDFEIGEDISFISSGPRWGIYLNSQSLQTVFDNTTFEKCELHNYGESLTITNSTFDDCYIVYSHRGNITITNETSFSSTWLYLENSEDNNNLATVTDCSFSTDYTMAAIDLWNYNEYNIENNSIDGYYNGIQIMQSGYGDSKKNIIGDNTITNCTQRGILAYGTRGAVYKNHISNNRYGVWFGDHSSMRLYGYSGTANPAQTQEIRDNQSFEVYASQYSFPIYFRYNVIIDDNNGGGPGDPLVYHSEGSGGTPLKDVRYNCWEDEPGAFVAAEDLYPDGYIWIPEWCPGNSDNSISDPDEDMFEVAFNLFNAEDYSGAKSMYEMLIEQYPQSKFAKAAMQELFALEKFISNDYSNLKQYYTNNTNPELNETGDYMISKCDIKLENWPDAISYYENIILDPETIEDSIFAIIDLGYVYFVMENNGYKSTYTGNLVQHKPKSKEQFIKNRNDLLSLIPGDQMSGTMKGNIARLREGELLQNIPNPFKGSTQIWYKLENQSIVQLNIYNYTGQLIVTINEGTKTKGTHHIIFDSNGLKNGIYFYSISINGQITDSKKMTIVK